MRRTLGTAFGRVRPIFIHCCLIGIVMQGILDVNGEVSSFMEYRALAVCPYWLATFKLDLALWVVVTTCVWAESRNASCKARVRSFHGIIRTIAKEHEFQLDVLEMEEIVNTSHDFAMPIQNVSRFLSKQSDSLRILHFAG
jgi:hypothetical protein